jgi:hypothetical protein
MSSTQEKLEQAFLERILYIGRDKFILLGTPQALINEVQQIIDSAKREAKNNEAGNIYKKASDIRLKDIAAEIVVGGTALDTLLRQLERDYGKDLIKWVYGDHNNAQLEQSEESE